MLESKKVICISIYIIVVTILSSCGNTHDSLQDYSEIDLGGFIINLPNTCTLKKYSVDDGAGGIIDCSRCKLEYQYGGFVSDLNLESENYHFVVDTVEYVIRTIAWPNINDKGSIVLILDDRNPKLDQEEMRLVRQLKITSINCEQRDSALVRSIYEQVKLK